MRRAFGNLLPVILFTVLACGQSDAQFLPIDTTPPNKGNSVAQLITQARASLERGDLNGECVALEQALTLDPTHKLARLALTDVFMRLGRWEEAQSQAQTLMSRFPTDTEPVFLLAMIALRRGDPQKASELAARCLARGDTRPEVYKVLALSEYLLHDAGEFEANIRAVLQKNPQDTEAQYFLARYLFEVKRYVESLELFQRVIERQPDHYKAHYYIGLLHVADNAELARAEFEASVKIVESKKIGYAWPFAELGRASNDAGDTEAAIDWLSRGIRNDPACPRNYYEYARALFQKGGATAEVKQALLEAVRLDPGYTEAYYLLARYYRKSGENQNATEILAKFKDLKNHPIPSPYGVPRR